MQKNQNNELEEKIIEKLKTVYDPEFPLVDMYTLGLIYDVDLKEKSKICDITMTFTTPTCPMADMIMELNQCGNREWFKIQIYRRCFYNFVLIVKWTEKLFSWIFLLTR